MEKTVLFVPLSTCIEFPVSGTIAAEFHIFLTPEGQRLKAATTQVLPVHAVVA
jgi:hypothetical protein